MCHKRWARFFNNLTSNTAAIKFPLQDFPCSRNEESSATEEYSYKASRAEGQIWRLLTTGVGKNATDGQCEK
jgi:hypothetical protein